MATIVRAEIDARDIEFDKHELADILGDMDDNVVLDHVWSNMDISEILADQDAEEILAEIARDTDDVLDAVARRNGGLQKIEAWMGRNTCLRDHIEGLLQSELKQELISIVLEQVTLMDIGQALVAMATPPVPAVEQVEPTKQHAALGAVADDLVTILDNAEEEVLVLR
jgi:hypothetical protein